MRRPVGKAKPLLEYAAEREAKRMERRLAKVIAMLDEKPSIRLAVMTTADGDPDLIRMSIAIRGVAAGELVMPKAKCDPWTVINLINRYGGDVADEEERPPFRSRGCRQGPEHE